MRLALALANSLLCLMYAIMRIRYSPEVLAAAHFHQPSHLLPLACITTALAVWSWLRWIRKVWVAELAGER